jgi:hypothetical protein
MTRTGRKPLGPALVDHLEGSRRAKERLEAILETLTGRITMGQACERLGISEGMLYRLRTEVLAAGLACLEPRPMGRPPEHPTAEQARCLELEYRVAELESDLKLSAVREEVARIMPPHRESKSAGKKTIRGSTSSQKTRRRRKGR